MGPSLKKATIRVVLALNFRCLPKLVLDSSRDRMTGPWPRSRRRRWHRRSSSSSLRSAKADPQFLFRVPFSRFLRRTNHRRQTFGLKRTRAIVRNFHLLTDPAKNDWLNRRKTIKTNKQMDYPAEQHSSGWTMEHNRVLYNAAIAPSLPSFAAAAALSEVLSLSEISQETRRPRLRWIGETECSRIGPIGPKRVMIMISSCHK